MSLAIRLLFEPVRTLAFGAISGAYMGVGTAFADPIRIIILQNTTDQVVMFSFDGINDHLPLPSNGYVVIDGTTNKTVDVGAFFGQGTRVYVKDLTGAPTVGSVYVTTIYGADL